MRIRYIFLIFIFIGNCAYAQTQVGVAYPTLDAGGKATNIPTFSKVLPKLAEPDKWEWKRDGFIIDGGIKTPFYRAKKIVPPTPVSPAVVTPVPVVISQPSSVPAVGIPPFNLAESLKKIDALEKINGVSIKEIERRALPGVDAETGFIGKDETIKGVLKEDMKTMYRLGVTHEQLGNDLVKVIQAARVQGGDTFGREKVTYNGQPLAVGCIYTRGFQTSILDNGEGFDKSLDNCVWSTTISITNLRNNSTVLIGGNVLPGTDGGAVGVIGYIKRYGFFEGGGNKNPYRVDPMILANVMGRISPADEKKLAPEIEKRKFKEEPARR